MNLRYWKKEPREGKPKRQSHEQSKKPAGSKNKANCPDTGAKSKNAEKKVAISEHTHRVNFFL